MLDSRGPVILVADDALEIRKVVGIALRSHGWIVHEAATTNECLSFAERDDPDVIILDVVFKDESQDGFDVCRKLRSGGRTAAIPIVMLTARSTAADRETADAAGATAYLPKPFGVVELVQTVRAILGLPSGGTPLGVMLLDQGRVEPDELEVALAEQTRLQSDGISVQVGELLKRKGAVTSDDVELALRRQKAVAAESGARRSLRIVIADDHLKVREGLRSIFIEQDGFSLVGIATNGDEALELLRARRPDVAVIDQEMPGQTGLDVLRRVREEGLPTRIILFSLEASLGDTALASGAAAFLSKDADPRDLVATVRKAGGAPAGSRVTTTARVASVATHVASQVARARRALAVMGVLAVTYAGGFLVAEPLLGAGAAILAIVMVALAGILLGPEAGIAAAALAAAENLALWQATGHPIGEPVLSVGGNGLGFLALIGVGAGFGAMRVLRGRLDRRSREVETLVDAFELLATAQPKNLTMLSEVARELVSADAVLAYSISGDGAIEVAAVARGPQSMVGQREIGKIGPVHRSLHEGQAMVLTETEARSFIPDMHSGIAVPVAPTGAPAAGVLVALAKRREPKLGGADAAVLARFAPFASFGLPETRTDADELAARPAR